MAGENADDLKLLERFTDEQSLFKSWKEAQALIRSKGVVALPDNATPDQIAAFNKAIGVPETVEDFIKAVEVQAPEGYAPTEDDKTFLNASLTRLHSEIAKDPRPANIAKVLQSIYFETAHQAERQLDEISDKVAADTDAALTAKWATEKDDNYNWYKAAVTQFFGADGVEKVASWRLADGSFLGDKQEFVEAFAMIGRQNAEDVNFLNAAGKGQTGQSIDAEYNDLMKLRQTDMKKYNLPETQARIQALLAMKTRATERSAAA